MARTFGTSPSDVVTDAAGNVQSGVTLTIKTDPGGVTITALTKLDGTSITAPVSDSDGRFPFKTVSDSYARVQAVTPGGKVYRMVADEAIDNIGQAITDAANAVSVASAANATAGNANSTANSAASGVTSLGTRMTTAESNIAALQSGTPGGGSSSGGGFTPSRTWKNFTGGYCQHRTGGTGPSVAGGPSTAIHQPGSIRAGEAMLAMGCTFLDVDLCRDAQGTFWVMHDKDLSLTTDEVGTMLTSQPQLIDGASILASKTTGGKYKDQPMVTLRQFLAHFAGRAPILAEPKDQAAGAEWAATVNALQTQAAGYLDCVIFTISATNVANNAPVIDGAGLPWGFYHQSANVNDATIRANAITYHCKNVMITTAATQDTVDAYRAAGITVIGFGSGRRASLQTYSTLGVGGIMDEFVGHLGGLGGTVYADPWRQGRWGNPVPATNHNRPILQSDGTGLRYDAPYTDGRQWCLMSEFSPLPTAFQLDLHLQVVGDPTVNAGNWLGVNVCNQSDNSFADNSGTDPGGYTVIMFPGSATPASNGSLRIVTRESGTQTTRVQSNIATAVPTDGEYWVRLVVSSSGLVASRRDGSGNLIGTATSSYADTRWRNGFLHVGGPIGPQVFKVRDLTITPQ